MQKGRVVDTQVIVTALKASKHTNNLGTHEKERPDENTVIRHSRHVLDLRIVKRK